MIEPIPTPLEMPERPQPPRPPVPPRPLPNRRTGYTRPDVNDAIIAWILFVCGLVYLISISPSGLDLSGTSIEGISIGAATRLVQGESLYTDFYAPYGPGRYYALRAAYWAGDQLHILSGNGLAARHLMFARYFWSLLIAFTALIVYLVCRHMMSFILSVVAAGLFILLHPPLAESYLSLFIAATALLIADDRHDSSPRRAIVTGLLIGFAFLFRELAGFATLAAALGAFAFRAITATPSLLHTKHKVESPWLKIPAVLVGAGLPITFTLLLFKMQSGELQRALDETLQSIHFRHNIGQAVLPDLLSPTSAGSLAVAIVAYLLPALYLITAALIINRSRRADRRHGDADAFGLAMAGGITYLAYLDRGTTDALLVVLLPALILTGRTLSSLTRTAIQQLSDPTPRVRRVLICSVAILMASGLLELLTLHCLYGREEGALRLREHRQGYPLDFQGTELWVSHHDAQLFSIVTAYFESKQKKQRATANPRQRGGDSSALDALPERLFCIPTGGYWNLYLGRPNPTYYEYTQNLSIQSQANLIKELEEKNVEYVIYDTHAMQRIGKNAFAELFPLIHDYLLTYFQVEINTQGLLIMQRKADRPMNTPINLDHPKLFAATDHDSHPRPRRRSVNPPRSAKATS